MNVLVEAPEGRHIVAHRFTVGYDISSLRDLRMAHDSLIVIGRRVLQFVALRFLVIDPQLRVIEGNQIGHALHG